MNSFSKIQQHVIDKLQKGLSVDLTYHNVGHTLDVLKQSIFIANAEGVDNDEDLLLLKLASLYHDVGFLDKYTGHEERSCEIAEKELATFGLNKSQIDKICGMIRATKVPQKPQTLLEQIICDSDLDYLGRPDFFTIGQGLFNEFMDQKIVSNDRDWNLLQIRFLEEHHYFTDTSKKRRQRLKQIHLEAVKEKVHS
jgi:uncharacterized protein